MTKKSLNDPESTDEGAPKYVDKSAESASNTFYPNRDDGIPAYLGTDPRYWEYR